MHKSTVRPRARVVKNNQLRNFYEAKSNKNKGRIVLPENASKSKR